MSAYAFTGSGPVQMLLFHSEHITDICGHGEGFLYLSGSSAISDLHNC